MNIHPAHEAAHWPLHIDTPVGDQWIANSTLLQLQHQRAEGIEHAHMIENAWISHADWDTLASATVPSVLKSDCGNVLAWIGDKSPDIFSSEINATHTSQLIRYPWELLSINEELVSRLDTNKHDGEVSPAAHIDGYVHLGEGSRILPGVVIEGNVTIGKNCKIGPNCYLRGNTTIGDDCIIGQAVEIKNSIIGHGTIIGHLSYVGDSVLGNKVNFGAGTITSNFRHDAKNHFSMVREEDLIDTGRQKFGAIVGDGTHTGILTAIYPGRKLAPGSTTRPHDTVQLDLR